MFQRWTLSMDQRWPIDVESTWVSRTDVVTLLQAKSTLNQRWVFVASLHRKNLWKSISGKDMGIPICFPLIGKKYSHTSGNLWQLVSHICELCGFFNSIYFYSKPIVWGYISFSNNISVVRNFGLPILCGLFGFCNNF